MTRRERHVAVAALVLLAAPVAQAQRIAIMPEARLDAIVARRTAFQAAFGADLTVARELRVELAAGLGVSSGANVPAGIGGRVDAVVHFLLDPQHTMRWSPYGGGGVGVRYDRGPRWRAVAILVAGVNTPRWGHTQPFIEAGLGGGVRVGVGLRRARTPR